MPVDAVVNQVYNSIKTIDQICEKVKSDRTQTTEHEANLKKEMEILKSCHEKLKVGF